jgi:hypothetical protein
VQFPPDNWFAPVGSSRSGGGGNQAVEAFDVKDRIGGPASRQAVTQVNIRGGPERFVVDADPSVSWGRPSLLATTGTGWNTPAHERSDPASPPGYRRRHARTRRLYATRETPCDGGA